MPARRRVKESAKRPAASRDLADLGVLFVHGIGDQEKGETLSEFKNGLTNWLEKWFASDPARFIETDGLGATDEDLKINAADEPVQARITFREEGPGGISRPSTWLLAESWWAKAFEGPSSLLELVRWLFSILAWFALWHVLMPLRMRRNAAAVRKWQLRRLLSLKC